MSRSLQRSRRVVALMTGVFLGLLVAYGAFASSPSPAPADDVRVTPIQAKEALGRFARTDNVTVSAAQAGRPHKFYLIDGPEVHAAVDAYTGSLQSISFAPAMPRTAVVGLSVTEALSEAAVFLKAKAIPIDGLSPSARLVDHGAFQEYEVAWQRRVNGALVPDQRLVSVNPETGEVFAFSTVSYPYDPPAPPAISEDQAVASARKLLDSSLASTIVSTDLVVTFSSDGSQLLIWRIEVRLGGSVPSAALVEVDAMTGTAIVAGRG